MHFVAMGQQQQVGHMGVGHQRITRFTHGEARLAFGDAGQPLALQVELALQGGKHRHAHQHGVHQWFG
ncbi:hypothetical protein D9M71_147000 [compost metagenome]